MNLFQMEDLPTELKVLISQYLDSNSKFHIRATNKFWRYLCKLDYFKVNGASSENLPRIIDTYSKIQQPFSLSFKNFKDIKVSDFVDGVTKLTNLTSLELDRILDRSYLYCKDNDNPWMNLKVMTQLIRFNPWCRTKYPLQLILHLTNLKEFQYNEPSWDRDDDRFRIRDWVYRVIPSLSQLENLELNLQYTDRNPFGLVANPSRLTRLLLAGETYNTIINYESLTGFVNLKTLKLEMSLPVEIEHFTALEDLKLTWRGNAKYDFENNQMLTRLVMTCQMIDVSASQTLRHLTNMKKLDIRELSYQDDQIRQDSDFEFLSQMSNLQTFKLNTHQAVSSEIFSKYVNPVNLKTIQWSFAKDIDLSPLAKFSNLRVLVLTQHHKEAIVNYDPISNLTNLTCLKIDGISSTHNATFISTLTMLKVLAIESANAFGGDLDLSPHLNLASLDILGTTSADVLTTVTSPKITRLCCPLQPSTNYELLLTHPLRHLQVTNDNEEFLLWKTIEQMTSLQRLVLVKIYNFPKLLQLIKLPDLQVLEFTNLKKFPLSYSTRLTSLREVICNGKTVYTRRDE